MSLPVTGIDIFEQSSIPINSSFSLKLPTLQIFMDSTSLSEFKICPRKYQLSIILGYQPSAESIHLTFGIMVHKALELYHQIKLHFQQYHTDPETIHNLTLREVVRNILKRTWVHETDQPWRSDDQYKNRWTLIRTIIWYLDSHGSDQLETVILRNGKPAVELPFQFETSVHSRITGEMFRMVGHLDRIVALNSHYYITDVKTTKSTIGTHFFQRYNPDNQFSVYAWAGHAAFGVPVSGLIVDAIQVAVGFSRFQRGLVERSDHQLAEWQSDLSYWLASLEECAATDIWPKNDTACDRYGGCPFRPVCSQPDRHAAQQVLEGHYIRRIWDPLARRGDI